MDQLEKTQEIILVYCSDILVEVSLDTKNSIILRE